MKNLYTIMFFFLCLAFLAQNPIPNPGFENWTSGSPNGWTTSNALTITPVSQSSDAHSGSSAAKLEVLSVFSIPFPPTLMCNSVSVSQNYASFSFYYKCNLTSADNFVASAVMSASGTSNGGGSASLTNTNNTNVYTLKTFSIPYTSGSSNSSNITFVISGASSGSPAVGSWVLLDDISFGSGTPTGIEQDTKGSSFSLGHLQPNPAKAICFVPLSLSMPSEVLLEVYTIEGKKVQQVIRENMEAGSYKAEIRADELDPGLYFCVLSVNGLKARSKFIVER
ncbi:MAG TPA: T9SS type A sorting domain-containing protein [Bacteroidia bacterium]|nr:T9SS type A sorting domain-containing protein [Bacteroidia bacterium]